MSAFEANSPMRMIFDQIVVDLKVYFKVMIRANINQFMFAREVSV